MTTSPASIQPALEALYRELERYRPAGPIRSSPYKKLSDVEPLLAKPLRELTADDLAGYSGSAVWTIGTQEDFKYFFPRMAELALHQVVGGSGWDSWASRLAPALSSESEWRAIR